MNKKKLYTIIISLAVAGLLLAVYLLWQQFFRPAFQPCNINDLVNCNAIISGPVAKTLGIPTPLYGLLGYIVILFAAVGRYKRVLFATASFGILFCLSIAYIELFQLRVICPVCIACQLIMGSIFLLSLKIIFTNREEVS